MKTCALRLCQEPDGELGALFFEGGTPFPNAHVIEPWSPWRPWRVVLASVHGNSRCAYVTLVSSSPGRQSFPVTPPLSGETITLGHTLLRDAQSKS